MKIVTLLRSSRTTGAVDSKSRTMPKNGCALNALPKGIASFCSVWWRASAPFALLGNSRKTGAESSAPPKELASSFAAWWRASAPFALLFLSIAASVLSAQDLTVDVHDLSGTTADTAITSPYQFASTPVGSSSSITVRIRDNAGFPVRVVSVLVSSSSDSANSNPNFTVTGTTINKILSTSGFEDATVSFVPLSQGALTGYLQIYYQVQKNGCSFTATDSTACASEVLTASTLEGSGAAPGLVLTYPGTGGPVLLGPNSSSALNFGNVSTSDSASITFTLSNQTGAAIAKPTVKLATQQFNSSAFSLDTSALNNMASIPAGGSGSFIIRFAPGQVGLTTATLTVGSLPFPIQGTGIVVADIDALQISYADSDGVRTLPQAANPIPFGQVVAGTNTPNTLKFTVTNPSTSWNAVALQTLAVSGSAFTLSSAPAAPLTIAPGASITFSIVFAPTAKGNYTGSLAIGTRTFSLSGSSISSALPDATLSVDIQPLTSGQQAHLSIQLASASTVSAIGQLTMTFAPSVTNITDDPAIVFLATNGRNLQVNVPVGGQTASYNEQTSIGFQTGTTAGTVTFTLSFPNKAPITQNFTIAPEKVSISSATAVRQSPDLVVTVVGFDNTYSAGKLSFTFYGTNGTVLTPTALTVDATSAFSQYFAVSTVGSAFSVRASFPVDGDLTQVGSVTLELTNSAGTTSATETFQ